MKRQVIFAVLLISLIGIGGLAYLKKPESPERILARHFGLVLPPTAKNLHAFSKRIPDTVIYQVWFRAEMPVEEAQRLAAALQLQQVRADLFHNPYEPDEIRRWWITAEGVQRDADCLVWKKATGTAAGGSIFAVWDKRILYLYRHGKPLAR